jgi:hypothetical protein
VLAFGHPVAVTALAVGIAVLVGLSALKGLHTVAIFAAIQPAVVSGYRQVSFGVVLLRGQSSGRPAPVPAPIVAFSTGALVMLLGAAAFIASAWFRRPQRAGCC